MVFPVVMFGCESWSIKKTECRRIDAFELLCWRRLCKEMQPVNPKEINPEYSLEGQMLKLKLQYFSQLMWRTYSLEKTLLLGKIEGRRKRGWQRIRWLDGVTDLMTWVWARSRNWWRTEKPGLLLSRGLQRVKHDWATEMNWIYPIANAICNCHVSPARLGSPKPRIPA